MQIHTSLTNWLYARFGRVSKILHPLDFLFLSLYIVNALQIAVCRSLFEVDESMMTRNNDKSDRFFFFVMYLHHVCACHWTHTDTKFNHKINITDAQNSQNRLTSLKLKLEQSLFASYIKILFCFFWDPNILSHKYLK